MKDTATGRKCVPGSVLGATCCSEAGDPQELPLAHLWAGIPCMASLAGACSCVSCTFPWIVGRMPQLQISPPAARMAAHAGVVSPAASAAADGCSPGLLRALWLIYQGVSRGHSHATGLHGQEVLLGWVLWQGVGSAVTILLSQAATSNLKATSPVVTPLSLPHSQNHTSQGCRAVLVSLPGLWLEQQCPP